MPTVNDVLSHAVALHQANRLEEAGEAYRAVLSFAPEEPNAQHLLGLVRSRLGQPREGAALIRRAIALFPTFEAYYLNLANLHRGLGEAEAAIDWYERGLRHLPASIALRELFCGLTQDLAVLAIKQDDLATADAWSQRCFPRLIEAPEITRSLYELLERQMQVAFLTGRPEMTIECMRVKNRVDFPTLPENELDLFTVSMHPFPEWCDASGFKALIGAVEAQPAPATLFEDYPDYLHRYIETLPELGRTPVGVAVGADIEVIQGFYVKDNYESFVLAGRRTMLCEDKTNVIRSPVVPLVGVPPGAEHGAVRLPRPLYREVEIRSPVIFVPSTPNYWHFMVEVLPRLMLCARHPETRDLPVVLFDTRGYQYEMFELAGIARERIIDMRERLGAGSRQVLYHLHRAAVPSPIPYPVAYRWLRETMLPKVRQGHARLPRRVFLSRRGSYPKHRIANDAELGEMLAGYGFEVVLPETLSVLETIELVAQAEIVVSPIGAGTSNHVYLPPYGTWIHLNNPDFFHPDSRWNAQMGTQATMVGTFRHLTGRFVGDPAGFPERLVDRLEIPIEIDLAAMARLVEEAEARLARTPSTPPA